MDASYTGDCPAAAGLFFEWLASTNRPLCGE
jgi:hypothetical protein